MMSACLNQLIHEGRRCLGAVMARCRLHDICYADRAGDVVVVKSRRPGSRIAIYVGNLFLKYQKCDAEILRTDEWIRWENEVRIPKNETDFASVAELSPGCGHSFTRRHLSGFSLRQVLKEGRYTDDLKFSAVEWAVDALCQLHRRSADWGRGMIQSVSHGDATVNNVIINFDSQDADWIDFDMRHLPSLSELDRRTDDLRALVFSAAVYLPDSQFPRLAETAISSINDRCLLIRFRERLAFDWWQFDTFQLAQAPLSWNDKRLLTELLLTNDHPTDAC
jgi:hypothetical protein